MSGTPRTVAVILIPKVAEDLRRTRARSGLSETDIVNRAITLYEFADSEMAEGGELMLRRPDGTVYTVELLDGGPVRYLGRTHG